MEEDRLGGIAFLRQYVENYIPRRSSAILFKRPTETCIGEPRIE